MAGTLSRHEKTLVANGHKSMLSALADNEAMRKNGEPLYYLNLFRQMEQCHLITKQELDNIADVLLVMECARLIQNRLKSDNEKIKDDNAPDTSKLAIGMVVKDYKTMCSLLGEKETTGAAKINQMENWKKFFDYEKIRYKSSFIIMDIYDEPLTAEEKKYRNSLFVNEIKVLLLKEISKAEVNSKGNIVYFTTYSRLIRRLNLLSGLFYGETESVFNFLLDKYGDLFSTENISWNYQILKSNTFRKLKNSVLYALNALEKDDMLNMESQYVIGIESDEGTMVYHEATDDEVAHITAAKKLIANKMGYRNSMDASLFRQADFNRYLTSYYKVEYGWSVVFHQLKIIANQKNINRHINEYTSLSDEHSVSELSLEEIGAYKARFNGKLTDELKKQALKTKDTKCKAMVKKLKEIDEYKDTDAETISAIFRIDEEPEIKRWSGAFPDRQNILIDGLVSVDSTIRDELIEYLKAENQKELESEDLISELDF